MNKKILTKTALAVSIALVAIWLTMGTGTTLAWFTDTTQTERNQLRVGVLDLDVSYRHMEESAYTPLEGSSEVFKDDALYEPGFTQTVFLKIENNGEVPFKYKLSVEGKQVEESKSILGSRIYLPDYLKFGVMFADSEPELNRELSQALATEDMNSFVIGTWADVDDIVVGVGEERYAAIVVFMPREVDNAANYLTGEKIPKVEMGVIVFAQQADAPLQ